VVQSGHHAGIRVAICGEMAAEPAYVIVLLGLGLDEFSMNPVSIPKVKKVLRMSRFEETRSLVEQLFRFPTTSEIEQFVRNWMAKRFPGDFIKSYAEDRKA
jgi:phosphotransferase system enzyme I (PtsI)